MSESDGGGWHDLRVATANLLHGLDVGQGGRFDLPAAAAALRAIDADVLALQEVDRELARSGGVDQSAELAAALGLHGVFAPALLGDPDGSWAPVEGVDPGGSAYGVALFSRVPVERSLAVRLSGGGQGRRMPGTSPQRPGWDREPRTLLVAELRAGGRLLRVATTHLSYLPWRGLRQLSAAARAVRGSGAPTGSAATEVAAVLLGDFNLPAWAVRTAARGWSHAGGAPTYPAWNPRLQVDHLLHRGPVVVRDLTVGPPTTSDHLPLVATVTLT